MDGDITQGLAWSYRINIKCFDYIEVNVPKNDLMSCRVYLDATKKEREKKRESAEITECSRMLHVNGFFKESHQSTQFSLNFIVMY